jgi:phage terminase large subunit-like protein
MVPGGERRVQKAVASREAVLRRSFSHLPPVQVPLESGIQEFPDYVGMALGYVDAVIKRKVPENEFIILACKRFRSMYDQAQTLGSAFFWDDLAVISVCAFVERCPQVAGAGKKGATLELEPFQMWILAAIFGFRQMIGNQSVRWTQEAFIDIPRKSGKTSISAPVDLYCFLYEQEQGSEIYLGATSRLIARKVLDPIRQIILAMPELRDEFGLKVTNKEIRRPDGGFITTISSIGRKEDGHNPHVGQIDELHAVPQSLHEVIASSLGARANQLFLKTTTAGTKASGPAYEERKRAERVLRGQEVAPRYFAAIYTIDIADQKVPLTIENVVKANPMLGVTVALQKIEEDLEAARFSPSKRAEFIVKRLNVYGQGASHAIRPADWDACTDKTLKLENFRGKRCWIGVDLSSHDDQTAISLIFEGKKVGNDTELVVFCFHFIPSGSVAYENEDMADQLRAWVEEGHLTETEGPVTNHNLVQVKIEEFCGIFDVESIVFDRAHSVQMAASLISKGYKAGIIAANAVEMAEPTKLLMAGVRGGLLKHDGNPVLAWNAHNVCVTPGDLPRPIKDRTAPHLKIDGISATTHGLVAYCGRVQRKEEKPKPMPFNAARVLVVPTGGANV